MLYTYGYMKRVVGPAGYTIVETMIFLAVSAALLLSASLLISGRQRKTQFTTTVKEFSSKLESVYGNVASGYYNSTGNVKCNATPTKVNVQSGNGGQQGTNGDCVFLGQVIVSPKVDTSDFQVISLVGRRVIPTSPYSDVKNLVEATPALYTDTAQTYTLAGAEFKKVSADSTQVGDDTSGSSVAFIGSLAPSDASQSGTGHTDVYTVPSNQTSSIETILGDSVTPAKPTNAKINYCLSDGEQYARVTLEGGTSSYTIGDVSVCS